MTNLPAPESARRFTGSYFAVGFSPWKKKFVRLFLPEARLSFVRSLRRVPKDASIIAWGRSLDLALARAKEAGKLAENTPVLRLEDGFLRSVGLGASLARPLSWVIDPVGIYYDTTAPSALEHLLQTHPFPEPLLVRAQNLLERILALNLTKYNVGNSPWTPPATNRPLFLVPGQVEFDASIRYGTQTVRTNLALLQAVRAAHPEAFLIYKPHPDVVAGLRSRGPDEAKALNACDAVVTDVSMSELLHSVEQVHVMTSLTGFEALLRQKSVVCYGAPFYAGWGLTLDRAPVPRGGRSLCLRQLVAAALLLYPDYLHPETNQKIQAEEALELLAIAKQANNGFKKNALLLILGSFLRAFIRLRNRFNDFKRAR